MLRSIPILFAALLLASACAPAPAPLNYPPISFAGRTPITLDVVDVDIVDEYRSNFRAPNVEQLAPVAPINALHQWVRERIRAAGSDKRLQVIIKDASIVEEKLPITPGVKGAFTNDQAAKYTGSIKIELRIYGDKALSLASTEVRSTRSQTLAEGASLAQRDQLLYDITKQMMYDVNAELENNIQQYLSNHIQYNY